MHRWIVVVAVVALAACSSGSSGSSSFALTSASVDPAYFCPGDANNAAYDLHATVQVHNGTTKAVTIDSVTAQMTLASVSGDWLEKIGERYDAGSAKFDPTSVPPGATTTVKVTISSACTSGMYGTGVSSSGDYKVTMRIATSAGSYSITAGNRHEIIAA